MRSYSVLTKLQSYVLLIVCLPLFVSIHMKDYVRNSFFAAESQIILSNVVDSFTTIRPRVFSRKPCCDWFMIHWSKILPPAGFRIKTKNGVGFRTTSKLPSQD